MIEVKDKITKEFLINYWEKLCSDINLEYMYENSSSLVGNRESASISKQKSFSADKDILDRHIDYWYGSYRLKKSIHIVKYLDTNKNFIEFYLNWLSSGENEYKTLGMDDVHFVVKIEINEKEFNDMMQIFSVSLDEYYRLAKIKFSPIFQDIKNKIMLETKKQANKEFNDFKIELDEYYKHSN